MSRMTLSALAIAATLIIPVALAGAKPKPPAAKPGNGQLTLSAAPTPIAFGGATTLSGRLSGGQAGGQPLVIEASAPPFTAYSQVATATTAANGAYSATLKPAATTRYRVTAKTSPPATSGVVTVGVRIRVGLLLSDATPRAGSRVVFSGRAYPAHDGALVSIRKRSPSGTFVTIARTRLADDGTSRSRYRRTLRIRRSGVYQVRVSTNDADHVSGISRARRITVHS